MDYIDSGIKIAQTVLPPAFQYFGRAKEREARLAQREEELAATKAQLEVLVMRNHELGVADAQVKVLEQKNQQLIEANNHLEAFKNVIVILLVVAAVVFVGMAITSKAA
jgi:hypothetical protein